METATFPPQTKSYVLPAPFSKTEGLVSNNPRYKICEYLLIFNPDKFVNDKITFQKRHFFNRYKNPAAIYGKPHITLANFIQSDIADPVIINRLKIISKNTNRIKVVLKDYGWFAPHLMYVNVVYKVDIQQLVRKISNGIKRVAVVDKRYPARFILEPHLTICKNMDIDQYEKSRIEYEKRNFSGEFTADAMVLLKRIVGEKKYQEIGRFPFSGPETLTSILQGNLFQ